MESAAGRLRRQDKSIVTRKGRSALTWATMRAAPDADSIETVAGALAAGRQGRGVRSESRYAG